MAFKMETLTGTVSQNPETAARLVERLFDVAKPDAVFGHPVSVGEQVVITASEVNVGMGTGYGGGLGVGPNAAGEENADQGESAGGGGGGGGGGFGGARPVAAIVVSPDGVWVEPIVDVTKVALAFFTMLGSMWMFWSRMRRASKR